MKDEGLIQHAFEQSTNCAARLYSFSTSKHPKPDGIVEHKQTLLALDDIATFAYHSRRLIDLTSVGSSFNDICISVWTETKQKIAVRKIFNFIIHSEKISIWRSELDKKLEFCGNEEMRELALTGNKLRQKELPTTVLIKSDHSQFMHFELYELITCFENKLLPRIASEYQNEGISLSLSIDSYLL